MRREKLKGENTMHNALLSYILLLKSNLERLAKERSWKFLAVVANIACILLILIYGLTHSHFNLQKGFSYTTPLRPLTQAKSSSEVFGFAPYWTFDKLGNVNFDVLTTFAYFGINVLPDGTLDQSDQGYETFVSHKATETFQKAHSHGTKVVLTLTQMENSNIEAIIDNPDAQQLAISQAVDLVDKRGIDGINVDFEYVGDPGQEYRDKFTNFVSNLTKAMHQRVPNSQVTVSVYAGTVKDPKIYDLSQLSAVSDGIFMMAYDFATLSADNAMPTAPLNGYKEGKYWYDVSTAVDDFLTQMPANKLILGVPWYGYNYVVYQPGENAETLPYYSWKGQPATQTYSIAEDNIHKDMSGITDFKTGWDSAGKVGWKAYYVSSTDTWRIIFLEDSKSLGLKFDFAKQKNLGGVGMWALGFDEGKNELWNVLKEKFGSKIANSHIMKKGIKSDVY